MSRVSRERAAENRAKVVAAASSLFLRKGLNGVGIREVMAEVGLTQGGFPRQFGSKDVMAGEACNHAFDYAEQAWSSACLGDGDERLRRMVAFYLAPKTPGRDCPLAALGGDAARARIGGPVRRAFTDGLRRLVRTLAPEGPNDRTLAVMAAMVGAAVLRRASDDAALADQIDAAVMRLTECPDVQL
jgi:TetR/AcrR family transcriptional regulator, transcriptional repressor for nem operon